MFEGTKIIDFTQRFKSDKDCLNYLSKLKWRKGFCCLNALTVTIVREEKSLYAGVPGVNMKNRLQVGVWAKRIIL